MERFVIAVFVENKSGVLTRVTSMFTRRGFNIDALTVGETENPEYSRITITLTGDEHTKSQIVTQLRKLINVRKVEILPPSSLSRELLLIKVKNDSRSRHDVLSVVDVFHGKIVDYSQSAMCAEITGEPDKIDAFIDIVKPYGIIEMCRTGIVAIERGPLSMLEK